MLPEDKVANGFILIMLVLTGVLLYILAGCAPIGKAVCESEDRYYNAADNSCRTRERHR